LNPKYRKCFGFTYFPLFTKQSPAQLADILNFSSTTGSFLDDASGLYAHPFYWISPILLARLELLNPFVVS